MILIAFILVIITLLNFFAFKFSLYWQFWWFDLFMHFLGGLVVSYISILFYKNFLKKEFKSKKEVFILALGSAFLVGLTWELFEFTASLYREAPLALRTLATLQLGWLDTLTDLMADLAGGGATGYFFIKKYYNSEIEND